MHELYFFSPLLKIMEGVRIYIDTSNDTTGNILFAIDSNGTRRSIANASNNEDFTCEECGEPLIVKTIYGKRFFSHLKSNKPCSLRAKIYDRTLSKTYNDESYDILVDKMVALDIKPKFNLEFTLYYVVQLENGQYIIDPYFRDPANLTFDIDLTGEDDISLNTIADHIDVITDHINIDEKWMYESKAKMLISWYTRRIAETIVMQYTEVMKEWIGQRYNDFRKHYKKGDSEMFKAFIEDTLTFHPLMLQLVATNYKECEPNMITQLNKHEYDVISQFYLYKDLLNYIPKFVFINYLLEQKLCFSDNPDMMAYCDTQLMEIYEDTDDVNILINTIRQPMLKRLIHDLFNIDSKEVIEWFYMYADVKSHENGICTTHVKKLYLSTYKLYVDITNLNIYMSFSYRNQVYTPYWKLTFMKSYDNYVYNNVKNGIEKFESRYCPPLRINLYTHMHLTKFDIISRICESIVLHKDQSKHAYARYNHNRKSKCDIHYFERCILNYEYCAKFIKQFEILDENDVL